MITALFLFIILAVAALIYSNAIRRQIPEPNMRREVAKWFMVAAILWLVFVCAAGVGAGTAKLPLWR